MPIETPGVVGNHNAESERRVGKVTHPETTLLEPLLEMFQQLLAYALQVCPEAVILPVEALWLMPDLDLLRSGT